MYVLERKKKIKSGITSNTEWHCLEKNMKQVNLLIGGRVYKSEVTCLWETICTK